MTPGKDYVMVETLKQVLNKTLDKKLDKKLKFVEEMHKDQKIIKEKVVKI